MEPIYACFFETRDHSYVGYGKTPEEAKKACLKGYRVKCRRVSQYRLTKNDIREFNDGTYTHLVLIGKCLIDEGREGWI